MFSLYKKLFFYKSSFFFLISFSLVYASVEKKIEEALNDVKKSKEELLRFLNHSKECRSCIRENQKRLENRFKSYQHRCNKDLSKYGFNDAAEWSYKQDEEVYEKAISKLSEQLKESDNTAINLRKIIIQKKEEANQLRLLRMHSQLITESNSEFTSAQDLENNWSKEHKDLLGKIFKEKYNPFLSKLSGFETLRKHTGAVKTVNLSNDGRWAITGSADGSIILWDLNNSNISKRIKASLKLNAGINSTAISNDKSFAAIGSQDGSVRLWDTGTPDSFSELFKGEHVSSVAISSDNRFLLISFSDNNNIKLWNVGGRIPKELPALVGHSQPVNAITFSEDGKLAASASNDCSAKVWDLGGEGNLYNASITLSGHSKAVLAIAFNRNGTFILTGSADNSSILWKIISAKSAINAAQLLGHTGPVSAVAFNQDGKLAFTGSADSNMKIWDIEDPKSAKNIRTINYNSCINSLSFRNGLLLAGLDNNNATLLNLNSNSDPNIFDNLTLPQWALIIKLARTRPYDLPRVYNLELKEADFKEVLDSLDHNLQDRIAAYIKQLQ